MKKLMINIFKTLFFFDLAVACFPLLPNLKTENAALLKLWQEGLQFLFMVILSFIFINWVEKKSIKLPAKKKKVKQVFKGIFAGMVLPVIAVAFMVLLKSIQFTGFNKISHLYFWIPALLFNAIATELLLRGYLYQLYKREYGKVAATVITTLLYISLNFEILSKGKIYVVTMLAFNVLLCLLMEYTGSMVITVTARFVYTLLSTLVLGSLTLSGGYPVLLKTEISGKPYITGSVNGIEGSIAIIGIIGIFAVIFLWRRYKPIKLIKNLISKRKA